MYNALKSAVLSSILVASAYGAMPQQTAATFSYTPKYDELRIPMTATERAAANAKTQYQFFADKDTFKARGSLEAQVSPNLHLDLAATLQVQNGESYVIPRAAITYKMSERADAKITYNERNATQYSSRMLRVVASIMF